MLIFSRALAAALTAFTLTSTSASAQLGPAMDYHTEHARSTSDSVTEEQPSASIPVVDQQKSVAHPETSTTAEQSKLIPESEQPLGLPRIRNLDQAIGSGEPATPMVLGKEFVRTIVSLAGVLLLIFALAHFYKRLARTKGGISGQLGAGGRAPAGLVEVLGRYPISSGMTLVVLRFDRKVLLLSHATGGRGRKGTAGVGAMQTLCEMSNAEDVASILTKVRDEAGDSIAASFERSLQEAGSATDNEISKAMYQPAPGVHVQRPRRIAPGFVANDEGDRLELTSMSDSPAASDVLKRRLGSMRRGR